MSPVHSAARPSAGANRAVAIALSTGVLCTTARASPAAVPEPIAIASRSVWVAPTYELLLTSVFEPSSRSGVGASLSYEFHVSSRFNLGLALAHRVYPGTQLTQQLGYGTTLKHFFSEDWSRLDGFHPFVDYGLLLQQTFIAGRGNAVSHDTRLGAGAVVRVSGVAGFVGVAGHYSRLEFFDVKAQWVPYLDAQLGWIYSF
jgi:hypothetical protein